jgi:hypothetical protein
VKEEEKKEVELPPKVPEDNDFFAFKRDRNATVAKMMSPQ